MLVLCWVLGRVWGWWEYAFFMGMEKGLYRAYVRRWMWNKMYTYIIRDKNTFSLPSIGAVRLLQRAPHQHKLAVYQQTETCSLTSLSGDVGGKYESIFSALCSCSQQKENLMGKDLRPSTEDEFFHPTVFSLSLSLFSRSICFFFSPLCEFRFSHETIFFTIAILWAPLRLVAQKSFSDIFLNFLVSRLLLLSFFFFF